MPDYLHLTRKGYRIWADAIEPTLWWLLDEGKPEQVEERDHPQHDADERR